VCAVSGAVCMAMARPKQMPPSAPSGRQTFPMIVLLGRLEQGAAAPWSSFLPDHLRPKGVTAKVFEQTASKDVRAKSSQESKAQKSEYAPLGIQVIGKVWEYSQDPIGCREVQHAIETADANTLAGIAAELHDHVWDATCCPHANHVLQRCIAALFPEDLQFIVDVLTKERLAVQAARHKYGCRIVQRLIEHCSSVQIEGLLRSLLAEVPLVSCHAYGNYVMQHILQHSPLQSEVCQALEEHLNALSSDQYGAAVVSCAMTSASRPSRLSLARAILKEPSVLIRLACSRHGHPAAREVVEVLDSPDRMEALRILGTNQTRLLRSRYGRIVAGMS